MKKLLFVASLLLILTALPSQDAQASHNMGVDLTYECINNCTIRVHLRAYRDCSGISTINPTVNFTGSGIGCVAPAQVTAWSTQQTTEVTPVCPNTPTQCNTPGATINGVQEYYWWAEYDICAANCSTYTMSWSDCCRNGSITSGATGGIYIGSTTIKTNTTTCNSSPQFANPPVPYICNGNAFTFNQAAIDPDGDSLRYYLGPCFASAAATVNYNTGYSPTQPLGAGWIVNMDSATGDITMVPNPGTIETAVLCIYVEEWRNGQLLNTIVRDMQITVLNCSNNNPYVAVDTNSIVGGSFAGGNQLIINTCINSPLKFDLYGIDGDSLGGSADSVCMWWDKNIVGAQFYQCNTTPKVQDSFCVISPQQLCATFEWTPTSTGWFTFLVTIRDNHCPILGQGQYTFQIFVSGMALSTNINVPGCGPVDLCGSVNGGLKPYIFSWSGSGGLGSNPAAGDTCLQHNFPGSGSYPIQLSVIDSVGCLATILDTVVIPNTVSADAGPDISFCSAGVGNIGAAPVVDEIYLWSPITGISNPNSANPTVTLINTGITPVIYTFVIEAFDTTTGCQDFDTVEVTVNPFPVPSFTMPTQTCSGSPVQITYNGPNPAVGPAYSWNFGPGATPASASTQGPHNVMWSNSGMIPVTLTMSEFGCTSSVYSDSILVFAVPLSGIAPVANQCFVGHTFNFNNTGTYGAGATFNWSFEPNGTPLSSADENPTNVTFPIPGNKIATLVIVENGCASFIDTLDFTVYDMPDPSWSLIGSPQCLDVNDYCFLSSASNGPGATYSWAFSDAVPATSGNPNPCNVIFNSAGSHNVTLTVTENGCVSTLTDVIDVLANPVADAGADNSFCEGEGGAQLNGSGQFGTKPYYWTWWCDSAATWCGLDSVHDGDPIANPTQTTTYYSQIIDFNGCESTIDSAVITVLPKPVVNAGPDINVCASPAPCQIITASVSGAPGPFSYQWTPSAGLSNDTILNPCARPDTTTIYTLVVSSYGNGCSSANTTTDTLSTVSVNVQPLPVAVANDPNPVVDICLNDCVELQGYGTAAGPNYNYQWSPSTGLSNPNIPNPDACPLVTTEYILTVISNGCPSYGDTVVVNVHTNPTVDAGPTVDICLGDNGQLDGEAWGDPTSTGYTYFWYPSVGMVGSNTVENPFVSPVSTTTYYVIATSSWGCESPPDSTIVNLVPSPQANAGENIVICDGESVQLNGSVYYTTTLPAPASQVFYTWSPSADLDNANIANPIASPANSTVYTLTVQHMTCFSDDEMIVTVMPEIEVAVDADTNVICGGDSVQLYASGGLGGAQFNWTPALGLNDAGISNPLAAPGATTSYQVIITEGKCSDTTDIEINVIPTPTVSYLSSTTEGCEDFTVNFLENTHDANSWVWDFGDETDVSNEQNPTHTFTEPGTYVVNLRAVGLGNCSADNNDVIITVHEASFAGYQSGPNYPVSLPMPNSRVQFQDLSENAVSWLWDFGDDNTSTSENPAHTFTSPGQYYVKLIVTSEHGCLSEIQHGPFLVTAPDVFIPNVFSPNGDDTNDQFVIRYSGSQPFLVSIKDRWGVQHYESSNQNYGWNGNNSSGKELPEGVYYYTVQIGGRSYVGSVTLLR